MPSLPSDHVAALEAVGPALDVAAPDCVAAAVPDALLTADPVLPLVALSVRLAVGLPSALAVAALLLAVIHHVAVTEGIPLREIFRTLAEMVRRGVIVEFVPPEDEMFARIVLNREHLIERSRREHFEAAFAPWFRAERCEVVAGSGRMLYALVKLGG